MSFEILSSSEALYDCRNKWNELSGQDPFQSWEWCVNWMNRFETNSTPLVLVDKDIYGEWMACAPMANCQTKLGQSKLYVMGSGTTCTDYTRMIANSGYRQADFTIKFCDWLSQNQEFGVVEFDGIESQSDQTALLVNAMQEIGYSANVSALENCWKLDLPTTWDELNRQFSKKHRRKTKKAMSRLASEDCTVEIADENNFSDLWDSFVHLHQLRRQMTGQTGCFSRTRFEEFLRPATEQLIGRGLARLFTIRVDDSAMASALLFSDGKNAFMYQTGFDPEFKGMEPGYMLIVASLNWAIQHGHNTFDFMRGDEPYKARWNTRPVGLSKIRFVDQRNSKSRVCDRIWKENVRIRKRARWLKSRLATVFGPANSPGVSV